ncbi:MAG: ROK family protein [bacterium]
MYYLGFDIGGSSVKAVLVENKKIAKSAVENLPGDLESMLSLVEKMKNDLIASLDVGQIGGIGFSLAGVLDEARTKMFNASNIKFLNGEPIEEILTKKFEPYAVKIEHDSDCFLLAEKEAGLAKDLKNVFYLTLGTGIGGAYMIDGKIILGAHGASSEVGHTIVDIVNGVDLEEVASNKFIKRTLKVGSMEAHKMAQSGDEAALKTFYELGKNLGIGIANIINSFDPEAIILSGGIAGSKDFILAGISESIEKYVISPAAKETKILFSELGRLGGALGAALLFDVAD